MGTVPFFFDSAKSKITTKNRTVPIFLDFFLPLWPHQLSEWSIGTRYDVA
jgi:hypothetical protein